MENTVSKRKQVWIDGNTLVEKDGARMVDFELNGNGYSAKLKAFIAKRDQALDEQNKAKKVVKMTEKESVGVEPEL